MFLKVSTLTSKGLRSCSGQNVSFPFDGHLEGKPSAVSLSVVTSAEYQGQVVMFVWTWPPGHMFTQSLGFGRRVRATLRIGSWFIGRRSEVGTESEREKKQRGMIRGAGKGTSWQNVGFVAFYCRM